MHARKETLRMKFIQVKTAGSGQGWEGGCFPAIKPLDPSRVVWPDLLSGAYLTSTMGFLL
jgi:hypothetical protein